MKPDHPIKITLALLAAAAAPASISVLWGIIRGRDDTGGALIVGWLLLFVPALAHALVLGLPAFLLLKRLHYTQWWVSLFSGFLIGAVIPVAIFFFRFFEITSTAADWYTSADWRFNNPVTPILACGALGMIGGFSAWLVWSYLPFPAKLSRDADGKK